MVRNNQQDRIVIDLGEHTAGQTIHLAIRPLDDFVISPEDALESQGGVEHARNHSAGLAFERTEEQALALFLGELDLHQKVLALDRAGVESALIGDLRLRGEVAQQLGEIRGIAAWVADRSLRMPGICLPRAGVQREIFAAGCQQKTNHSTNAARPDSNPRREDVRVQRIGSTANFEPRLASNVAHAERHLWRQLTIETILASRKCEPGGLAPGGRRSSSQYSAIEAFGICSGHEQNRAADRVLAEHFPKWLAGAGAGAGCEHAPRGGAYPRIVSPRQVRELACRAQSVHTVRVQP